MPSLFDVAKHFDDVDIFDAYSNAYLFKGQFSNFLESSADGTIAQRRTMSLAPTLAIPARRCIKALDTVSIVGQGNVDGIYNQVIRQSFWTKKALASYQILTPLEAINNAVGTVAYGHGIYEKDLTNVVSNSQYDPFWSIYFSPTELVTRGKFLKVGSTVYRVRSAHLEADGLTAALSDELDADPYVTITLSGTGSYDPVTDTYGSSSTTVPAILVDRYKWFDRLTEADAKNLSGDMTLVVAASIAPGSTITLAGRAWQVLTSTQEIDAYALHIRRS